MNGVLKRERKYAFLYSQCSLKKLFGEAMGFVIANTEVRLVAWQWGLDFFFLLEKNKNIQNENMKSNIHNPWILYK